MGGLLLGLRTIVPLLDLLVLGLLILPLLLLLLLLILRRHEVGELRLLLLLLLYWLIGEGKGNRIPRFGQWSIRIGSEHAVRVLSKQWNIPSPIFAHQGLIIQQRHDLSVLGFNVLLESLTKSRIFDRITHGDI